MFNNNNKINFMIYYLSLHLKKYYFIFSVIKYITFRSIAGFLTSFILTIILGKIFLNFSKNFYTSYRIDILNIERKNQTPSMGGIFIIISTLITIILWAKLTNIYVIISILTIVLFSIIGFIDDYSKIIYKNGIHAKTKFALQITSAIIISILLIKFTNIESCIYLPFFKNINIKLGYLFILWSILVIVSTSNAVNLTDGLDGLAIGSIIPNFLLFSIIIYLAGNQITSNYLNIPFCNCAELSIISSILAGSSLGFLWYNSYPAYVFMGDTGALPLGAILGTIAIISKHEYMLTISGAIFILETLSVIIQVISYKYRKKRIFIMSPIHHHFQLKGYPESIISVRFTIISIILSLIALITIKIR